MLKCSPSLYFAQTSSDSAMAIAEWRITSTALKSASSMP